MFFRSRPLVHGIQHLVRRRHDVAPLNPDGIRQAGAVDEPPRRGIVRDLAFARFFEDVFGDGLTQDSARVIFTQSASLREFTKGDFLVGEELRSDLVARDGLDANECGVLQRW